MNKTARYLRVSLVNQCNLACSYCKPDGEENSPAKRTAPRKFTEAISLLHKFGIRKVRFTGGEPTLYKELPQLVAFTRSLGSKMQIGITSNGLLLNRLAEPLAEAGLDSVNISLDTIDPVRFNRITGSDKLHEVIAGIEAAKKFIPTVKLNCVVMAGVNDDGIEAMIRMADSFGIDIRFIEFMPTKNSGGHNSRYISGADMREQLPFEFIPIKGNLSAAARYYQADNLKIKVGFIDPVSHSFCANCDRIRLTSDGALYGCLFSGNNFNLFRLLAEGESTALRRVSELVEAKQFIGCAAVNQKPNDLPSFVNMGG